MAPTRSDRPLAAGASKRFGPALCGGLVSLLLAAASSPQAQTDARWQTFATSAEEEWSTDPASMTTTRDESGATTVTVHGRMRSKGSGQVDLIRWSVTLKDCRAEAGRLRTSDLGEKYVVFFDYEKGGSTFESLAAQSICNGYFNANK